MLQYHCICLTSLSLPAYLHPLLERLRCNVPERSLFLHFEHFFPALGHEVGLSAHPGSTDLVPGM